MKRVVMLSFVLALVLAASAFATPQQFAGMEGAASIGVDVPSNWEATKITVRTTANEDPVPAIRLRDKSDNGRVFLIYLALAENEDGQARTMTQVGNILFARYSRSFTVTNTEERDGYYAFSYLDTDNGDAERFVLMGHSYDNRIQEGYYLTYQYTYDTLTTSEVNAIESGVTINGQSRNSDGSNSGGVADEGESTGTNTTNDQPVSGSGGGGGGCSAGFPALALLTALSALIIRKAR